MVKDMIGPGVSILQENLIYSLALNVVCQILPQLQSYRCLVTRGIDPSLFSPFVVLLILWGCNRSKRLLGPTGGGCLRGEYPLRSWKILYFWNWNHAIWWKLVSANLEQATSREKKKKIMDLTDPKNIFSCAQHWEGDDYIGHPPDKYLKSTPQIHKWPINHPFENRITFCMFKWVIPKYKAILPHLFEIVGKEQSILKFFHLRGKATPPPQQLSFHTNSSHKRKELRFLPLKCTAILPCKIFPTWGRSLSFSSPLNV